ncbi:MAG: PD-(D/E)XK nuclease family protein, partial [Cyclobacteriaceae bacterium]|nr:PD-(D/E)XK nuclease family protein [Cyclobacteriaceae bacterium]
MKFLEEIVEIVLSRFADAADEVTIVFPNRRAGLFFQKYLAAQITKPVWSPRIVSIEDFIKNLSGLKSADKLDLIFDLYRVFTKLNKSGEDFDKFFYWGNIMLQDFDELD